MRYHFLRWIFVAISTFFIIAVFDIQAQTLSKTQRKTSEALSPDFKQLYIVFAGPYPASPSSAFGHLFFLLEPNESNKTNMQLWKAVNFAADVEDHSGLSTLYNGLMGNLAGSFEEMPFYKKIREYTYAESRDLWLFPVQLSESEKIRFRKYINDHKGKALDYRFTDKNCATRVNEALFYTLNEPHNKQALLLPQDVLSSEVIQSRLEEPLWIENIESQMINIISTLADENVGTHNTDTLTNKRKAKILKLYEWLYNNKSAGFNSTKVSFIQKLRYEVSRQKTDYQYQDIRTKNFRIHHPGRIGFNYAHLDNGLNNLSLDFRLGLHGFEDFTSIYPKYDYINLLKLKVRFSQSHMMFDEFWLFYQASRQPKNEFRSPASWDLGMGGKRYMLNGQSRLAAGLYSALGKTYNIIFDKWSATFMIYMNPVYLEEHSWNIIFNPKLENRFFITNRIKTLVQLSNPVFLQSKRISNTRLFTKIIYSINNNLYLSSSLDWQSNRYKMLFGININLSI